MRRLLVVVLVFALAGSTGLALSLQQPGVAPQSQLRVERPAFVGESVAAREGVSLALGKGVEVVDPLALSLLQGDFLVVDANWFVAKASAEEVAAVRIFFETLKPVLFIQVGANLTKDQITAFVAATGDWHVVMSFMAVPEPQDYGDLDDGFIAAPEDPHVVVGARLIQMKANPAGSYDLERFGEASERTAYDWSRAEEAVAEVSTKALQRAGVSG